MTTQSCPLAGQYIHSKTVDIVLTVRSLLDEPFTGVVYLKESGITSDFRTLKGKRIGYVGEFGKIQIDELVRITLHISDTAY